MRAVRGSSSRLGRTAASGLIEAIRSGLRRRHHPGRAARPLL